MARKPRNIDARTDALFTPIAADATAGRYVMVADPDPEMSRIEKAEAAILREAAAILERRIRSAPILMKTPSSVRAFLSASIGALDREVFVVIFLNAQHGLISAEQLFIGTLNQTAVYPREIVRRALQLHAMSCILAHCHPSGQVEPSSADRHLTTVLVDALRVVDVAVIDHIIVAGAASYSFAEHGLL
ncbi:MAG: RadC family protein [Lautropia sp.]